MMFLTDAALIGSRPAALRLLERRPLVALGGFSYSLYLFHLVFERPFLRTRGTASSTADASSTGAMARRPA